jgi:hypothetical protein
MRTADGVIAGSRCPVRQHGDAPPVSSPYGRSAPVLTAAPRERSFACGLKDRASVASAKAVTLSAPAVVSAAQNSLSV